MVATTVRQLPLVFPQYHHAYKINTMGLLPCGRDTATLFGSTMRFVLYLEEISWRLYNIKVRYVGVIWFRYIDMPNTNRFLFAPTYSKT